MIVNINVRQAVAGLGWAGLGWDRDIGDQMVTRGPGHKSGDTLALEQTGLAIQAVAFG